MFRIARMSVRTDDVVEPIRIPNTFAVELKRLAFILVVYQPDRDSREHSSVFQVDELRMLGFVVDDHAGTRKAVGDRASNTADILRLLFVFANELPLDGPGGVSRAHRGCDVKRGPQQNKK